MKSLLSYNKSFQVATRTSYISIIKINSNKLNYKMQTRPVPLKCALENSWQHRKCIYILTQWQANNCSWKASWQCHRLTETDTDTDTLYLTRIFRQSPECKQTCNKLTYKLDTVPKYVSVCSSYMYLEKWTHGFRRAFNTRT